MPNQNQCSQTVAACLALTALGLAIASCQKPLASRGPETRQPLTASSVPARSALAQAGTPFTCLAGAGVPVGVTPPNAHNLGTPDLLLPVAAPKRSSGDAALIVAVERFHHSYHYYAPWRWGVAESAAAWEAFFVGSLGIPAERVTRLHPLDWDAKSLRNELTRVAKLAQAGSHVWFVYAGLVVPDRTARKRTLLADEDAMADATKGDVSRWRESVVPYAEVLAALSRSRARPVVIIDAAQQGSAPSGGTSPAPEKLAGVPHGQALVFGRIAEQEEPSYPGTLMPVFSYALLGALRGWADANNDGSVSLNEIASHVQRELDEVLGKGKGTAPVFLGPRDIIVSPCNERQPPQPPHAQATNARTAPLFNPSAVVLPELPKVEVPPAEWADSRYRDCYHFGPDVGEMAAPPYDEIFEFPEYYEDCHVGTTPGNWADAWCNISAGRCSSPSARKALEICVGLNEYAEHKRRVLVALAADIPRLATLLASSTPPSAAQALRMFWDRYPMLSKLGLVDLLERTCRRGLGQLPPHPSAGAGSQLDWVTLPLGLLHRGDHFQRDLSNPPKDLYDAPEDWLLLSGFDLLRTEVTVDEYRRCVAAGACSTPKAPLDATDVNYTKAGREKHPVNYVIWQQAEAFCRWLGGRLPSEAEWEYAARSTDTKRDNTVSDYCGECGAPKFETAPVCSHPEGSSAERICDLSANVWEWVADGAHPLFCGAPTDGRAWGGGLPGLRVLRGGTWNGDEQMDPARHSAPQDRRASDIGFRCARD